MQIYAVMTDRLNWVRTRSIESRRLIFLLILFSCIECASCTVCVKNMYWFWKWYIKYCNLEKKGLSQIVCILKIHYHFKWYTRLLGSDLFELAYHQG